MHCNLKWTEMNQRSFSNRNLDINWNWKESMNHQTICVLFQLNLDLTLFGLLLPCKNDWTWSFRSMFFFSSWNYKYFFYLSQTHALIEFLILFLLINLNDTVVTLFKVTQNTDKSDFYLIRDIKDVNLSLGHVLALDDKNKLWLKVNKWAAKTPDPKQ